MSTSSTFVQLFFFSVNICLLFGWDFSFALLFPFKKIFTYCCDVKYHGTDPHDRSALRFLLLIIHEAGARSVISIAVSLEARVSHLLIWRACFSLITVPDHWCVQESLPGRYTRVSHLVIIWGIRLLWRMSRVWSFVPICVLLFCFHGLLLVHWTFLCHQWWMSWTDWTENANFSLFLSNTSFFSPFKTVSLLNQQKMHS